MMNIPKEFLNLKGTDWFLNELSGDKFEISGEGETCSIMLDKTFKLDLKKINYHVLANDIVGTPQDAMWLMFL